MPATTTTLPVALLVATLAVAALGDCGAQPVPVPPPPGARNVLLIVVDDLRPEMLRAYKQTGLHTPALDRFAETATVFQRAYCQQAICGPTRNSFLSGRRPQRTQAWNFIDSFREVGPDWQSLPGYFKNNGYTTLGAGKVYHPGLPPEADGNMSWSDALPYVDLSDLGPCQSDFFSGDPKSMLCPDNALTLDPFTDYRNYQNVLEKLLLSASVRRETGRPFFLAYGAHKPHLPFRFPVHFGGRDIWAEYGPDEDIPLPKEEAFPKDMPAIALPYCVDGQEEACVFDNCYPIPGASLGCPQCGPALPHNATRLLRKGYYAAVSWTDHLVGLLLRDLDLLGLTNDTVVALIGDHGWQLGEHNVWSKQTNFELATRVPLLIRAAGQVAAGRVDAIVESVDLYPTLAALAGLPPPPDLDGTDLSPLMNTTKTTAAAAAARATSTVQALVSRPPSRFQTVKPVPAAFSEFPRCAPPDAPWNDTTACVHTNRSDFVVMGYTIRTEEWRCTLWMWWDGVNLVGNFSRPAAAVEFYPHVNDTEADFDEFENVNLAAAHPVEMAACLQMARTHWGK